jgi:hypothetical protein
MSSCRRFNHTAPCAVKRAGIVDVSATDKRLAAKSDSGAILPALNSTAWKASNPTQSTRNDDSGAILGAEK